MSASCRKCGHGVEWIDADGVCQYGANISPLFRACGCTKKKREDRLDKEMKRLKKAILDAFEMFERNMHLDTNASETRTHTRPRKKPTDIDATTMRETHVEPIKRERSVTLTNSNLLKGERIILIAAAQREKNVTREYLTVTTGYKRSSRDTYIGNLQRCGYMNSDYSVTPLGLAYLGDDYKPLPKGKALREYWLNELLEGEALILEAYFQNYPKSISRVQIDDYTNNAYKRSSRDTYIGNLVRRQLIVGHADGHRASPYLFGHA